MSSETQSSGANPGAHAVNDPASKALPQCDLVMKGGIASGVVYPGAVVAIAKKYRLRSLGGASAGAIAAGLAAAAEYARESRGFERLQAVPKDISTVLFQLFQPTPETRPLYDLVVAVLAAKTWPGKGRRLTGALVRHFLPWLLGALATWVAVGLGWSAWLLGFVLAALLLAGGVGQRLWRILFRVVPGQNYGLCSGMHEAGGAGEGLTQWLHARIQAIAGLQKDAEPLTFGELLKKDIRLAIMTTDLGQRRPYHLPFERDTFYYNVEEFKKLFPDTVLARLSCLGKPHPTAPGYLSLPPHNALPPYNALPVIVAVRMSLSFPLLLQGVPLYREDETLPDEKDRRKLRRCLFSDGGISSNFPIHFFDKLLPSRPTFGINLEDYVEARHAGKNLRMDKTREGATSQALPVDPLTSLPDFLMTIVNAAKDWRDTLQRILPGYRERVVHVALKAEEGGMNLNMPPELVEKLSGYGGKAGGMLLKEFDFDAHRWQRFLVAMELLEDVLGDLHTAYDPSPPDENCFKKFLADCKKSGKCPMEPKKAALLEERLEALAKLGEGWQKNKLFKDGRHKPDSVLRVMPRL